MKKRALTSSFILLFCLSQAFAASGSANQSTPHIRVYFNNPVDTTVGGPAKAVYLNNLMDDTLVAYINRAVSSLDIAVYNFSQTTQTADVAAAVNNAFNRGVKVRWIYNSSSANSGLSQLNPSIHTLASPNGTGYGIMHNKFMVADASLPSAATVWTGSMNWNSDQYSTDVNNVIIFQDQPLALAYKTEFEEMWGDTGTVPNLANSRFGPFKSNNTQHLFQVDGHLVESYFSPSDQSGNHLLQALRTADSQLFFGVYTFTDTDAADTIISRKQQHGVYTAGILDQYSISFSAYPLLNTALGSQLKVYSQSSLYHNKFSIIDPCNLNSDPIVTTGSYNWTISADTKNDENLLIIHSADIASQYYQSFTQNFADLGGSLVPCTVSGINEVTETQFSILPNPSSDFLHVNFAQGNFQMQVFDMTGKQINVAADHANLNVSSLANGIYLLQIVSGSSSFSRLFIVSH